MRKRILLARLNRKVNSSPIITTTNLAFVVDAYANKIVGVEEVL